MSRIHVLPERVANQIAAGEVVERPAAVIKELVENALDSGASRVEVEFRQGGRELLRVEDNGCGMAREDALLALQRHATSKISETADLDRLATFGFRGEALPSIASVSRFTLQTRPADSEAGTEILVDAGRVVHVRDCGRPAGTGVSAAHIFGPVPARRKFLKSDATEAAHIVQTVRLYALARPDVAFTLTEDSRVVLRSPECATLAGRAAEIFGRQAVGSLLAIEAREHGLRLSGLVGRPGDGRATRHELLTYVNGRPVDSRALSFALVESYSESLPKGRYPRAILFLECDPAAVDVNVHPAKREVRFRNEAAVRAFVVRSVLQRLRELGAQASPVGPAPVRDAESAPPGAFQSQPPAAPVPALGEAAALFAEAPGPGRAPPAPPPGPPAVPAWRFLGLAHDLYAIFETAAGIVLLDRGAAHERIWYERLRSQFAHERVPGQRLLFPVPLELDPIASAILLDRRPFLEEHGFGIGEFGRNFFRIEAAPAWMEAADAEPFLRDVLGELREGRLGGSNPDIAREEFARLAAARAIRLPPAAGAAGMEALVAQLFATGAPLASPAGRATFVEIDRAELARRFQGR